MKEQLLTGTRNTYEEKAKADGMRHVVSIIKENQLEKEIKEYINGQIMVIGN